MSKNKEKYVPFAILHTMIRVTDLEKSVEFYTNVLGMRELRRENFPDGEFTLSFLGYGDESNHTVLELTYNYEADKYEHGSAFGHLALGVRDIHASCKRLSDLGVKIIRAAGPIAFKSNTIVYKDVIAFIEDPDGYKIELIEKSREANIPDRILNSATYWL